MTANKSNAIDVMLLGAIVSIVVVALITVNLPNAIATPVTSPDAYAYIDSDSDSNAASTVSLSSVRSAHMQIRSVSDCDSVMAAGLNLDEPAPAIETASASAPASPSILAADREGKQHTESDDASAFVPAPATASSPLWHIKLAPAAAHSTAPARGSCSRETIRVIIYV